MARLLREHGLRRAVALLGPRRVGKTILICLLVADLLATAVPGQRVGYVEMDHPLLHGQTLEALVQQIEQFTLIAPTCAFWYPARPPRPAGARAPNRAPGYSPIFYCHR